MWYRHRTPFSKRVASGHSSFLEGTGCDSRTKQCLRVWGRWPYLCWLMRWSQVQATSLTYLISRHVSGSFQFILAQTVKYDNKNRKKYVHRVWLDLKEETGARAFSAHARAWYWRKGLNAWKIHFPFFVCLKTKTLIPRRCLQAGHLYLTEKEAKLNQNERLETWMKG